MSCNCDLEVLAILTTIDGRVHSVKSNKNVVGLYLKNELPESIVLFENSDDETVKARLSKYQRSHLRFITNKNKDSYAEYLI